MSPRARRIAQVRELQRLRLEILRENVLGQRLRQQHAVAADETARLRERAMRRDEIRPRNAIAVEKDAIGAGARRDRAIADFGEPKAASSCQTCLSGTPSFGVQRLDHVARSAGPSRRRQR